MTTLAYEDEMLWIIREVATGMAVFGFG